MTDLSCDVVRDLLPAYADHLTSDETGRLVEAHLSGCKECRRLLEDYRTELRLPPAKNPGRDRKTLRSLRFQQLWYLFWPLLYAAGQRFQLVGVTRLMVIALVMIWGIVLSHHMMYNFDTDDTKKEFYEREERAIAEGRGTFFVQGLFWALPIGLPLLFSLIPWLVSQYR